MRKLLLYVCLIILIILGVVVYNYNRRVVLPMTTASVASSAPWQPAQLMIPSLHINASVMSVGATADGKMDAPVSQAINSPYWTSVFWYEPGAAPGQAGNAVIAGHVDRVGGDPAVFWPLNTLTQGNTVQIQTVGQKTLTFVVDRVVKYPADDAGQNVLQAVFGPTKAHHLNLITCSGAWTGQGYDERLVVFTSQIN